MTVEIYFSLMLFAAFIIYMHIGTQVLPYLHRGSANRLVFALSFLLVLWSFGFSVANSAASYESALFWRRLSAFGWGAFYAVFLHLMLVLFGVTDRMARRWSLGLIYVPAMAMVFIFSLSNTIAPGQFNLIHTDTGWVNMSSNNIFDTLFNVYYLTYVFVCLLLILRSRRNDAGVSKKTANLMLVSILAAGITASITDIVLSAYFPGNVPQMAPLFLIFPVIATFVSNKRSGLISLPEAYEPPVEGSILDDASHAKLYTEMARITLYGGYAIFIARYFMNQEPMAKILVISLVFFVLAAVIYLINSVRLPSHRKDIYIACVTAFGMPVLLIGFSQSGAVTTWVLPVVVIMLSTLIDNRKVLMMNSFSGLLTMVIIGLRNPELWVLIGDRDHFLRIFMLIVFIIFASSINRLFVHRIKENESLAYYDGLTGLPNRTLFNNRLQKEIELCKRTNRYIGIFFIDLDAFKSINDTLGHESGDLLLKNVAEKIQEIVRDHDTLSRFGGDEFLLMVRNVEDPKDLTKVADKLVGLFQTPTVIGGHEFFVTASIGISVFPNDGDTTTTLIKHADMAMYAAKEEGKNRYSFSSSVLKDDVMKRMMLTNSLYRALERNELELYYQPQISTEAGRIVGAEALLRWHHPDEGLVPPLEFIYLAEQTGLIIPIGEWVLRTACEQNVKWQMKGYPPVRMAVNLSMLQFQSGDLVATVATVLEETGMKPGYLELEITESIATKGTDHVIRVLEELKALGVTISIDDFGTEYSSLSRIKVMPVDRIKMDKGFVQSISKSSKDDGIVRIIIQLARSLELKVIAEGVETGPQLDFLTQQACDEVQGYYYYKPMTADQIEKIFAEGTNLR